MNHVFYCDGTQKKISWVIQTENNTIDQQRDHAYIYLDKVTEEQSKYIALHVGIFWSIGRFIIKNQDTVNVMLDSKSMFDHLTGKKENTDSFIQTRTIYLNQLVDQRKIKLEYELINSEDNLAHRLV